MSSELRYGTSPPALPSTSAEMTSPRYMSDLLMFEPSFSPSPVAPVFDARSEPARSTRLSLAETCDPPNAQQKNDHVRARVVGVRFVTSTGRARKETYDRCLLRVAREARRLLFEVDGEDRVRAARVLVHLRRAHASHRVALVEQLVHVCVALADNLVEARNKDAELGVLADRELFARRIEQVLDFLVVDLPRFLDTKRTRGVEQETRRRKGGGGHRGGAGGEVEQEASKHLDVAVCARDARGSSVASRRMTFSHLEV